MSWGLFFIILWDIFIILVAFRFWYTKKVRLEAAQDLAVMLYGMILSKNFQAGTNYFDVMLMSFHRYSFSFWLWGKNKVYKPTFRKLMSDFLKDDSYPLLLKAWKERHQK